MLCCAGLIGGLAVGQSLGGPWTYIAPVAGFGIGLLGDMKLMGHHRTAERRNASAVGEGGPDPARRPESDESAMQCQVQPAGKSQRDASSSRCHDSISSLRSS